ncbi:hypothetical protein HRG84_23100 [Flavisolibacter sp. BT320]|nr:hypothetical protein [Flavisolibacter longurius]
MPKSILFITTNSLATNPRLVKELWACLNAGHQATVISFSFQNWSGPLDEKIRGKLAGHANLILLSGDRTDKWQWMASTAMNVTARYLSKVFPSNLYLATISFSKRSWLLLNKLKMVHGSYDLVIAHNPGAFVPAHYFAKRHKVPLGIDLEDYHPGESSIPEEVRRSEYVLESVCQQAAILTASSQRILCEAKKWLDGKPVTTTVIRNVFSRHHQPAFKDLAVEPLKLIWFSQTVGLNRGIQDAILAMNRVTSGFMELTIAGYCQSGVREQLSQLLTKGKHRLRFLDPLPEADLIETCSRHHIGLALEPGFSLNNELALSNKLFAYLLAGNAVVASETKAQKEFMQAYEGIGQSYPIGAVESLARIFSTYIEQPILLQKTRDAAWRLAKTELNWEEESGRFLQIYKLN